MLHLMVVVQDRLASFGLPLVPTADDSVQKTEPSYQCHLKTRLKTKINMVCLAETVD